MPHCILEYSDNVTDQPDWPRLLRRINDTLVSTGLFAMADIKSRAVRHACYVVGDGSGTQAFITLSIQILDGRSDDIKARIAEAALEVLADAFPRTFEATDCSVTVQVVDIHRPSYRRRVSYGG